MEILDKLNIVTNNISLYEIAFTHTSYCNENKSSTSYERLEFLGDKILDFIVSEYLYKNVNLEEGAMTKLRASHVCEDALAEYALKEHFDEYLRLGKGEELTGGRQKKAILADSFEAFIGALYIDQGMEKTKEFINNTVILSIKKNEEIFNDYKSILQEMVQTDRKTLEYVVIKETGPAHDKEFVVNVVVENIIYGSGSGKTKKEAEQNAAHDALKKMAK
ncbi:MAG: ribonuclease III [Bacilli bacterium]